MSQKFYTLITTQGAALLANATALGIPLKLTKMAVGDANGSESHPTATQTKLIHEVYRAPINTITTDKDNPNQIIAELVIPETQGGWFINEIGLYDDENNLIAVGNCPVTYKPKLVEGSGRTQVIRMIIIVDNVDSVQLKIDPAVVLATRKYVDELIATKMANHEKTTNHPNATTKSKGFVQLSSATNSSAENQAATPLAIKTTYDLAAGAVKKSGDVINGQLTFENKAYGIKFNYENPNWATVIRPAGDNFSFNFYDAGTKNWFTKFRYTNSGNAWRFENIDDVTINGNSVLKKGDGGLLSYTRTISDIFSPDIKTGFYRWDRNSINTPVNNSLGYFQKISWNADESVVMAHLYNSNRVFKGIKNKNTGDIKYTELLKFGDFGIGSLTGAKTQNFDEHLVGGFYQSNTGDFPNLPFKGGSSAATLIAFPSGNPNWKVEKLAVVNGKIPRIYYRSDTKNEGKQSWYEAITTANANQILPVGIPQPWPSNRLPGGWLWCDGAPFDVNQFPRLASVYPWGTVPDLRGLFIRGNDNGRGIDPNRELLSYQGDAIRNIYGRFPAVSRGAGASLNAPEGVFRADDHWNASVKSGNPDDWGINFSFDASRIVPVANENRPKNVTFNYIVRAE